MALNFVLNAVSWLPLWLLYWVSDGLYYILYYVLKYRRQVVETNLRHSFPNLMPADLQMVAKQYYRNLCDMVVETLATRRISPEALLRRNVLQNHSLYTNLLMQYPCVVGSTSHINNWEWTLQAHAVIGVPIDAAYKPLSNKPVDGFMLVLRSRFGAHMIPDTKLVRQIVERKNIKRVIAMVADQGPIPSMAHRTIFLNQPTAFFIGPEKIARSQNSPLLIVTCTRVARGMYVHTTKVVALPPYNCPVGTLTELYARMLEKEILAAPSDWLWSHKRWKRPVAMADVSSLAQLSMEDLLATVNHTN